MKQRFIQILGILLAGCLAVDPLTAVQGPKSKVQGQGCTNSFSTLGFGPWTLDATGFAEQALAARLVQAFSEPDVSPGLLRAEGDALFERGTGIVTAFARRQAVQGVARVVLGPFAGVVDILRPGTATPQKLIPFPVSMVDLLQKMGVDYQKLDHGRYHPDKWRLLKEAVAKELSPAKIAELYRYMKQPNIRLQTSDRASLGTMLLLAEVLEMLEVKERNPLLKSRRETFADAAAGATAAGVAKYFPGVHVPPPFEPKKKTPLLFLSPAAQHEILKTRMMYEKAGIHLPDDVHHWPNLKDKGYKGGLRSIVGRCNFLELAERARGPYEKLLEMVGVPSEFMRTPVWQTDVEIYIKFQITKMLQIDPMVSDMIPFQVTLSSPDPYEPPNEEDVLEHFITPMLNPDSGVHRALSEKIHAAFNLYNALSESRESRETRKELPEAGEKSWEKLLSKELPACGAGTLHKGEQLLWQALAPESSGFPHSQSLLEAA